MKTYDEQLDEAAERNAKVSAILDLKILTPREISIEGFQAGAAFAKAYESERVSKLEEELYEMRVVLSAYEQGEK